MEDCNPNKTPAATVPLGSHKESARGDETWSYASIVGMLLYLSMHTRPDLAFAVSQVSRFTSDPREPHNKAVKYILRYLKATRDKGLIMKPARTLAAYRRL